MINLPNRELPQINLGYLYFPYKLMLENIQRGYTATQHREFLGHVGTTGQALFSLKLNYHEIHIVDRLATYDDKAATKDPHDIKTPRWIYYYVVESDPEVKKRILARLSPLNPIAINAERTYPATKKTTMDEYFIKSDYDAGYSTTNVHLFFLKEDTFEEFPDNVKKILDDVISNDRGKTHLKPSEMPYICCFCDTSKYVTSGPKEKDCIVVLDSHSGFISEAGFEIDKKNIYHGGSLFIGSFGYINAFSQIKISTIGKDIIIGVGASVYFANLEDGVIIGMSAFLAEQSYIGKKAIIHDDIKIERNQSIGPYQEVKAPYPTILGKYLKRSSNGDVNNWLEYINQESQKLKAEN